MNTFDRFVLAMLLAMASAVHADWPTLHGDYQRSGYSEEIVAGPYERKWFRNFTDEMIATRTEAIVAAGKCYVGTFAGKMYALDIKDGSTVWTFEGDGPIGHSACYRDGRVYFATDDAFNRGTLYCVSAADGKLIWKQSVGAGIWVAPLVTDTAVYFGDRGGRFHALSTDGKPQWTFETGYMILTPASLSEDGQRIVFGSEDMHVYCIDPAGKLVWKSPKLGGLSLRDYAPTIWQGLVIVRTNPAIGFHAAAGLNPSVSKEIQKAIPMTDEDKILEEKSGHLSMKLTPRRLEAERKGFIEYLKKHPEEKTFHVFQLEDGKEPWVAPMLFTIGLHNPATPPTFNPKTGEMYVIFPTALEAHTGSVPAGSISPGQLDRKTGLIEHIRPIFGAGKLRTDFLQPADETQSLSLMGGILLNTHQGSIRGIDLTKEYKSANIWSARDSYGGIFGIGTMGGFSNETREKVRQMSAEGYVVDTPNEWHGPARAIAAISDGRVFWVVGNQVVCIGGKNIRAAETGGTKPPAPFKRDPSLASVYIPGGNVRPQMPVAPDKAMPVQKFTPADLASMIEPSKKPAPAADALASEVRGRLDKTVLELIEQGPWAPLILEMGISREEQYFNRASEGMQIVALALPHLSPDMQAKAKAWLDRAFAAGQPLKSPLLPQEGKRREYYDVGPGMLKPLASFDNAANINDLYAVWAYAHYADAWPKVLAQKDAIRRAWTSSMTKPPQFDFDDLTSDAAERLNRTIAGALGYVRIMQKAGESSEADKAAELLAQLVTLRVHHEKSDPRYILPSKYFGSQIHGAKIPRYVGLVPELGFMLRTHTQLEPKVRAISQRLPVWYQAFSERLVGGENYITPIHVSRGLFAAFADALAAPPAELTQYLDQPWCKADLYYIEKLSATLRAADQTRQ